MTIALLKKNKEIEQSFFQWVFRNNYGWKRRYLFQIAHNPILMMFVNLCLYFDWFSNKGRFKPGDKVKYNFFAHVVISGIEELKNGEPGTVYTFIGYETWSKDKGSAKYLKPNGEEDGCSVFWLRKIYPWEQSKVG